MLIFANYGNWLATCYYIWAFVISDYNRKQENDRLINAINKINNHLIDGYLFLAKIDTFKSYQYL